MSETGAFYLGELSTLSRTGAPGIGPKQRLSNKKIEHKRYIDVHVQDMPDIRNVLEVEPYRIYTGIEDQVYDNGRAADGLLRTPHEDRSGSSARALWCVVMAQNTVTAQGILAKSIVDTLTRPKMARPMLIGAPRRQELTLRNRILSDAT